MTAGFIVLHRSLLDWEWYQDANTARLFLHCLLKANYTDKKWKGQTIERGSFVTSLASLKKETGLSIQNIRTSLSKLELTNELTIKSTKTNRLIYVVNYDKYQELDNQVTNKQQTNQQTTNKRLTITNKRNKETIKDIKEGEALDTPKNKYGKFVTMQPDEYDKLIERYGQATTDKYIERIDLYCGSKGKRYKDYYMTVISWINKDADKEPAKMTYTWQEELKAEQQEADSKEYQPKRNKDDIRKAWNNL